MICQTPLFFNRKAFPCISTGVYGYSSQNACPVALKTTRTFLEENPGKVRHPFNYFLFSSLSSRAFLVLDGEGHLLPVPAQRHQDLRGTDAEVFPAADVGRQGGGDQGEGGRGRPEKDQGTRGQRTRRKAKGVVFFSQSILLLLRFRDENRNSTSYNP